MKTEIVKRAWLVASLLLLLSVGSAAQRYDIVRLVPYGNLPYAGINNQGDVVGYNSAANWAFLYTGGAVTSLGVGYSAGTTINNNDQVLIYSSTAYHSYLYSPPSPYMVDIGTLGGTGARNGGFATFAASMNDSGSIVGYSSVNIITFPHTVTTVFHAFLYSNGQMTDLGSLSQIGNSAASGINSPGQIVGWATNSSGYMRAVQVVNSVMTDLDPGATAYDSNAAAINDLGQIVVVSNKAFCQGIKRFPVPCRGTSWYSLVYSGGTFTNIGNLGSTLGTYANAINNYGDIVGMTYPAQSVQHAFLYRAGTMLDLNNHVNNLSGWSLWSAAAINDLGQIVCFAHGPAGEEEIVLLNPTGPDA